MNIGMTTPLVRQTRHSPATPHHDSKVARAQPKPRRQGGLTAGKGLALGSLQQESRRQQDAHQLRAHATPEEGEDEHAELLPEEDWTVPGGYQDSLSKNTKLGRAVDDACTELDHLGKLEKESLKQATELLRKLGYKGDLTSADTSAPPNEGH